MIDGQKYEAKEVNVYNSDEMKDFNWKSFGLGVLIALMMVPTVLVSILTYIVLNMNTHLNDLSKDMQTNKTEVIQLLKEG